MNSLVQFAERIEEQLASANRKAHWEPQEAERYMAEVSSRREQFERLASRLNETVVRPRLESLASYFSNAALTENEPAGYSVCWLGYCERFPASTKVAFSVEHDVRFEKVAFCFEASMMPVFIKFAQHDRLTLSLDEVDDNVIADWVEERLLEFVDSYLRIDRGGEYADEEPATDPVCGMRISRSSAAATSEYRGEPYYFCSAECRMRFDQEPTAYIDFKML